MSEKQVWFITGAGRGMGVHFAQAALAAGHAVVATGRRPEIVREAVGDNRDLLFVRLDVTVPAEAKAAVEAAVERFGRIDVLVKNAANFYDGLTPDSATYATPSIDDCADRHAERVRWYRDMNGHQEGDPRQARPSPTHHHQPGAATAPVHRPGRDP